MKKLFILAGLFVGATFVWAADDLRGRPDIYGPAPSQWNYTTISSTATIKSSPGVLHCVTVSSAPANIWSVRDAQVAGGGVVISTFPASAQVGTYCYDVATSSGIQVVLPVSTLCSITVSYR